MLNDVRAVAFDLDNTLWDVEPVIARAEARMHQWLSEHCPRISERVSITQMRETREQVARAEPHNAHDFTYLRIAAVARHARECGYEEEVAQRAFEVFFAARNDLELYPDVHSALERLGSRFQLATLSNGNADLQRIGLAKFFPISLNARQIGIGKPHPRCFERLARDLRLEPRQVLYVGDDPVLDVEAARAAGMQAAWMNRRALLWPVEVVPADLAVTNCNELATALRV